MKNKFISLFLVGVLLLTPATVFADSVVSSSVGSVAEDIDNEIKVGQDTVQNVESTYSSEIFSSVEGEECQAYITKTSSFSVVIPKTIILDGSAEKHNTAEYSIRIKGDLGANQIVKVVPDSSFAFKQEGKSDVTATVTQDYTEFQLGKTINVTEEELEGIVIDESSLMGNGITTTGSVSVEEISAGSWSGSFKFNISMENETSIEDETPVNLITFTVVRNGSNLEFSAEEGMTWAEFIDSSYSNNEFGKGSGPDGDVVVIKDEGVESIVDGQLWITTDEEGNNLVSVNEVISANTFYAN